MTSSHDSENRRHLGTKQGGRSLDTPHPVVFPIIEVLTRLPATRDREFQIIVVPGIPGTSASKLYICLGDASSPPVYSWVDFLAVGAGAPSTIDFLVGTATSDLSAEIVAGTAPGGELGGTWPSPTVDTTHSGSSHAGVVTTHEAAADPHTGYLRESMVKTVLSGTFAIDSTGVKTITTAHGLSVTPDIQDVQLTVTEDSNVDDWAFDLLKVESVDATNVVAKLNVSTASATGGATAKLAILVVAGV